MRDRMDVDMKNDDTAGTEVVDSRIKREVFPAAIFIVTLLLFAVITTIQMKIIGNYIDYRNVSRPAIIDIFGFWFIAAIAFTFFISWQIRKKYQEPIERLSRAAKKVADGDFSVYLRPEHTQDKADCLDVLVEDFNKMVGELGSIETLKTDFFSNVSHEFKTPLAVISSNAEMLSRNGELDVRQKECVDNISASTRRLSDLIQNMLKLNKLEKQTITPSVEVYDVCAQLCECAVQFEEQWEQKNIEFDAELEDSAFIAADPGLMELVWNNLLSNAVKFTPDGGSIKISQRRDGGDVVVSVSDTGYGIDKGAQKHIFDKFYQADASHSTNGNGLGLALVKRIIELSDADIFVESEPGKGTTFTVRMAGVAQRDGSL